MKTNLIGICLLFQCLLNGQVGINTSTPSSTFDVYAARDASGVLDQNKHVGIQAPRITRTELSNSTAVYGAAQQGTMIYITDVSGGNRNGQRANIDLPGYYYFDSTANLWQKMLNGKNSTAFKAMVGNGQGILNLTLLEDYQRLNFNPTGANIFYNGAANPIDANGTITIQESGIYAVGFYFRYGTGANLNLLDLTGGGFAGVRINKNGSPIDSKAFSGVRLNVALIGLLSVVISNTEINTIYQFNAGDQITFDTRLGGLLGLGLLSGSEGSFFMYKVSN